MMSLKSSVEKLRLNGPKNIYVAGLCLKDGELVGYKIYNKIYEKSEEYYDFLKEFGGQNCLNYYQITKEWQNQYPGFSGFTCGVEISHKIRFGFGFKDNEDGRLSFNSFLINPFNKESAAHDKYGYVKIENYEPASKFKLKTDIIEVNENKPNSFCFCPKIDFSSLTGLEYDIKSSLEEKNVEIFNKIKESVEGFFVVNFGKNKEYEKIYIVGRDNKNLDSLLDLIKDLTNSFGSASLLK